MSNNSLFCTRCKSHHHPVDCPLDSAPEGLPEKIELGKGRIFPQEYGKHQIIGFNQAIDLCTLPYNKLKQKIAELEKAWVVSIVKGLEHSDKAPEGFPKVEDFDCGTINDFGVEDYIKSVLELCKIPYAKRLEEIAKLKQRVKEAEDMPKRLMDLIDGDAKDAFGCMLVALKKENKKLQSTIQQQGERIKELESQTPTTQPIGG